VNPKITVLMPVYNGQRYLAEAIESILVQTFTDFEFLVINDGSTDSSREIICSFDDPRIRLVDNPNNMGLSKSLNRGLDFARGEYIARQDCDDVSLPERIERQVAYLNAQPEIALLGSYGESIDQYGNRLRLLCPQANSSLLKWQLLFYNNFIHSSVMFNTEKIRQLGGYNTKIGHAQDYYLWTRIMFNYDIAQVPEVLVYYRSHTKNISSKHFDIQEGNVEWIVIKNIEYLLNRKVFPQTVRDLREIINKGKLPTVDRLRQAVDVLYEIYIRVIELWTPDWADAGTITKDYANMLKHFAITHACIQPRESLNILKKAFRVYPVGLFDISFLVNTIKILLETKHT
jgi:glycosyltransferase involved in cell wall biosynthesis